MNNLKFVLRFFLVVTFYFFTSFKATTNKRVYDFSLKNVNGQMVSTTDYKKARGFMIIFTCNHCPFDKLYSKRLNDLHAKYEKLNVPLLAINSMDSLLYEDETFDLMKQKAKKEKFNFQYLLDENQLIGASFGAQHTPTAFVIWKENNHWTIRYKGSIDDNGEHPEKATPYLSQAVDELLANKKVTLVETESLGCKIYYRKTKS